MSLEPKKFFTFRSLLRSAFLDTARYNLEILRSASSLKTPHRSFGGGKRKEGGKILEKTPQGLLKEKKFEKVLTKKFLLRI